MKLHKDEKLEIQRSDLSLTQSQSLQGAELKFEPVYLNFLFSALYNIPGWDLLSNLLRLTSQLKVCLTIDISLKNSGSFSGVFLSSKWKTKWRSFFPYKLVSNPEVKDVLPFINTGKCKQNRTNKKNPKQHLTNLEEVCNSKLRYTRSGKQFNIFVRK